jgi:hypothetical protein
LKEVRSYKYSSNFFPKNVIYKELKSRVFLETSHSLCRRCDNICLFVRALYCRGDGRIPEQQISAPRGIFIVRHYLLCHTRGQTLFQGANTNARSSHSLDAFGFRRRVALARACFMAKKDKGNNRGMNLSACARMAIVSHNRAEWKARQPLI